MIKLKEILNILKENDTELKSANSSSTKTINDEFQVNDWMLADIQKMVDKINKKLRVRNIPELKVAILDTQVVAYSGKDAGKRGKLANKLFSRVVYTIKVEGDIPQFKDYEFIAKIEHGKDGNIINMSPNSSVKKLPDEYKTFNQKCDICGTNRERLNTFIIKKIDTGELIVAGSSCLKKFMPLDIVKAIVEYSIRLNDMRNVLVDYEEETSRDWSGWGGKYVPTYEPKSFLALVCVVYFNDGGQFISKSKAEEWGKASTLNKTLSLLDDLEDFDSEPRAVARRKKAEEIVKKYEAQAEELADKILLWAKSFDFDSAALKNPQMDSYYHNLKVLLNRPVLETKHLGYFTSIMSLYLRAMDKLNPPKDKKENTYYGNVGDKFTDIKVQLKFLTAFETAYGTMFIYSFQDDDGHNFVYKGQPLRLTKGDDVLLSGTIKAHQNYKGTKQTIIQRPKIKKV